MRTITLAMAMLVSFTAFAREAKVSANQPKPLSFIENKGQVTDQNGNHRKDIDVKLATPGMSIFVGNAVIHYQWYKSNPGKSISPRLRHSNKGEEKQVTALVETYRMDVELLGANKNAEVVLEEKQGYYENFYLPQCLDGVQAHSYNRITYKDVYPGIDWVLYSKNNELKYDFVVKAGANAALIKLRYRGATALAIENGALIATTSFGVIKEAAPYSYTAKTKQAVSSSYQLNGDELSFQLSMVPEEGLVIDPSLNWGTYFGGTSVEASNAVATDTAGNAYIAGQTQSTTNIATSGAFQQSFAGGNRDAFIAKFNMAGALQWATYYGGNNSDEFYTLACEPNGTLYAGGEFRSVGLATAGAHQPSHGSNDPANVPDGLLAKFDANGQRIWATYYGGQYMMKSKT